LAGREREINDAFPYHLQGANGTDENVIEQNKTEANNISYHAAKCEENARTQKLPEVRLEVCKFSCKTLYIIYPRLVHKDNATPKNRDE
jgi:hypothetical protein